MRCDGDVKSAAAPATVGGKPLPDTAIRPLRHWRDPRKDRSGKVGKGARSASQETCQKTFGIVKSPRVEGRKTNSMVSSTAGALSTSASKILPLGMSAILGLFIVGFVGFSHLEVVHNAAHDTRHSLAFPCH